MDHVTTYIPDSTSVPWPVLATIVLAAVGFSLLARRYASTTWRSGVFITLAVASILGCCFGVCNNVFASADHRAALSPTTYDIADRFGLAYISSGDSSYGDEAGHVYTHCYATSMRVDAHHMSSKLMCSSNGSRAVAIRKAS